MYTVSYKLDDYTNQWTDIPCTRYDIAKFTALELLEDGYIVRVEEVQE
jgi:hypothetical protein